MVPFFPITQPLHAIVLFQKNFDLSVAFNILYYLFIECPGTFKLKLICCLILFSHLNLFLLVNFCLVSLYRTNLTFIVLFLTFFEYAILRVPSVPLGEICKSISLPFIYITTLFVPSLC